SSPIPVRSNRRSTDAVPTRVSRVGPCVRMNPFHDKGHSTIGRLEAVRFVTVENDPSRRATRTWVRSEATLEHRLSTLIGFSAASRGGPSRLEGTPGNSRGPGSFGQKPTSGGRTLRDVGQHAAD